MMPRLNSTWGERLAALLALWILLGALMATGVSCGGEDLIFSGEFPTETPRTTPTPTPTENPDDPFEQ